MKIVIVGAGITGLATYLFLQKHLVKGNHSDFEIYLYESHHSRHSNVGDSSKTVEELSASTALVGGGLGVGPNGMRVLRDLDPKLHDAVTAQGFIIDNFTFKAARNNWTLFLVPTSDKRDDPEEKCVASSRHGLWTCLRDLVPDEKIVYRKVSAVATSANGRPIVKFADGSEDDEADLVLGADGVKSIVRKSIFSADGEDKFGPKFDDYVGVGGFLNTPIPEVVQRDRSMVFTFAPRRQFGYSPGGPISTNNLMWWSSYETFTAPAKTKISVEDIRAQLKERHGTWGDPVIQNIIENAAVDTMWPVWTTPHLPTWSGPGSILLGDAAHALSPTSGQGASQGFEDAQTLSLLLAHYLPQTRSDHPEHMSPSEAIQRSAKLFYDIRSPRVVQIAKTSAKASVKGKNANVVSEFVMYFMFWLVGNVPFIAKLLLGDTHKVLYHWNAYKEVRQAIAQEENGRATS